MKKAFSTKKTYLGPSDDYKGPLNLFMRIANPAKAHKKIISQMPGVKYFEVELKDDKIELKPLRVYETDLEKIRSKMKNLGLKPESVREAVEWARSK